jgi:hypothetical protein
MVNIVYAIGNTKMDDMSGFVGGYAASLTALTKLTKFNGGDLRVTAGKTYKIFRVVISNSLATVNGTLKYDDDGAGTNAVTIAGLPVVKGVSVTLDVYFTVPALKYVTFTGGDASYATQVIVEGIEM